MVSVVSVLSGFDSGNELSDAELLDEVSDSDVSSLDVLELELGSLGDEIHSLLSFLCTP